MLYKTENTHEEVDLTECYDINRYSQLIEDIVNSDLDDEYKRFLKFAATRFVDLNYSKIAQYYYNLEDNKIKDWFKKLNLVLVDDKNAIENGYVKLTKSIVDNLEHYIKEK